MSENRTRKLEINPRDLDFQDFRARHIASIVVLSGGVVGSEHILDESKIRLGRGPEVDLEFEDSAMSREHALLEFSDGGFVMRDLGSTNGIRVNGEQLMVRELDHGDRLEIGEHVFQFLIENREQTPPTYVIVDE